MSHPRIQKHNQKGASLVVGLLLLLVITILAVAVIQVVLLQERMSRNLRDQTVAFQAAESALREAERQIASNAVAGNPFQFKRFTAACTVVLNSVTYAGVCLPSTTSTPRWRSVSWADNSATTIAVTDPAPPAGVDDPRYMIELVSGKPTFDTSLGCSAALFRISARGFGPNGAESNLQSLFRLRVENCDTN